MPTQRVATVVMAVVVDVVAGDVAVTVRPVTTATATLALRKFSLFSEAHAAPRC